MHDFSLTLQGNTLIFIMLALIIAALAYFTYRVTVPPVPGSLKAILILLRALGMIAVLMLFFEPVFTVISKSVTPSRVALLIDDSKSMSLRDGSGDRGIIAGSLLRSEVFHRLHDEGKLDVIKFNVEARRMDMFHPDSIQFTGAGTDIDLALKTLSDIVEDRNVRAGVLISDGNHNLGPAPVYEAERLAIPLFTVGIGDSLDTKDVMISRVIANEIAYTGTETPVDVRIRSTGFGGVKTTVSLTDDGGRLLDEREIVLGEGTAEYELSFMFRPEEEGMQRFTVSTRELPGEITYGNNSSSFYMRVIDRKVNILLIGGAPSQDIVFLRRLLETDDEAEVILSVYTGGGAYIGVEPDETALREADLVILAGFPTRETPPETTERVITTVQNDNKPLLFIESGRSEAARIESLLPVSLAASGSGERRTFPYAEEHASAHSILRGRADEVLARWSELPPVFRTTNRYSLKAGSESLMLHRSETIDTGDPFLVIRQAAGSRSAAVLGYGLWRWRMLGRGSVDGEGRYDNFFLNITEWLTADPDQERVTITSLKEQFLIGERIEFVGVVYDEQYRPLSDAEVRVTVKGDDRHYAAVFRPRGHGRYEGNISPLPAGEYEYAGTALFAGKEIGAAGGKFYVGDSNLEYRDTRMNAQQMRRIADVTGGLFLGSDDHGKLETLLNEAAGGEPRIEILSADYRIWNLPLAMAMLLFFFSLEWFLRKRYGML